MAQCPVSWSGSWSPSVTICITAQRSRNASVIVPELAEIGDNYEFVNQFRPLWSDPGCRMSISAMQRSSDFSWVAKKKDVWMIAPPFFILILSNYLEHDLIYSVQNVSAKSGSCAHFFQMCKTCTKRLVPELVAQRGNCWYSDKGKHAPCHIPCQSCASASCEHFFNVQKLQGALSQNLFHIEVTVEW